MIAHPWHEVPVGDKAPSVVNAVVEIPKGSRAKYEIDKKTGLIKLDRVLYGSMMYPAHYGIIPQTLFDDGDPLDILIFTQVPLVPLTLVSVKVIGVMRMIDQGVPDDKILAVAATDPSVQGINDIADLPNHMLIELKNFFENYTKLEGKIVTVPEFLGKEAAYITIDRSIGLYDSNFKK
jgi:inorganic pyrophosphatase